MTTHQPHGIVPPHLLQHLADSADADIAEAARRTLELSVDISVQREYRAARADQSGLIPPQLRDRARSHRTTGTELRDVTNPAAPGEPGPQRTIYTANQGTTLPGTQVRAEGQSPVADESANEAYDGLGDTFALYWQVFQRNSLDDKGLPLIATVHYDKQFDNAYWDGQQMVFGDGDGVYFQSFTDSVDVIGHELTHGVTQYTAGLTYVAQPGALNESMSDCFGSMVKQWVKGQTAEQADWLIGEGLFTAKVNGVALRSMKAPGTAYDDPHLGKDPQPADMTGYQDLPHDSAHDNGGVHINSGIPNRAFYLAATGIGGNSWEGAGRVWYAVLTGGKLAKDVDFKGFAQATIDTAGQLFGASSSQRDAVSNAWKTVKVL